MIPCNDCGAAFWTLEGLAAHPCIGSVPAENHFFPIHSPHGLNAAAGNSPYPGVR